MALGFNTNVSALSAQQNLQKAGTASESSIGRLSSGNRIAQASDDVAGLAIGTRLATNVSTIRAAIGSASQGGVLLAIADGGLSNIGDILARQKSLAVQANAGSLGDTERAFLNQEFQALSAEIDRLVDATTFNGVQLIDGSIFSNTELNTEVTNKGTQATFSLDLSGFVATDTLEFDIPGTDADGDGTLDNVVSFTLGDGTNPLQPDVSGANAADATAVAAFLTAAGTNSQLTQAQRNFASLFTFSANGTAVEITAKQTGTFSNFTAVAGTGSTGTGTLTTLTAGTDGDLAAGSTTIGANDVIGDSILTAVTAAVTSFDGDEGFIDFNGTTDAGVTTFTFGGTDSDGNALNVALVLGTDTATANASGALASSELVDAINADATLSAAGITAAVVSGNTDRIVITDTGSSAGGSGVTITASTTLAGSVEVQTTNVGDSAPLQAAQYDLTGLALADNTTGTFTIANETFTVADSSATGAITYDAATATVTTTDDNGAVSVAATADFREFIVNTINLNSTDYFATIDAGTGILTLNHRDPANPTALDETTDDFTSVQTTGTLTAASNTAIGVVTPGTLGNGTSTTTPASSGIDVSGVINNSSFVGEVSGFEATYVSSDRVTLQLTVGGIDYVGEILDTTPSANTTIRLTTADGVDGGGYIDLELAASQGETVGNQVQADVFAARLDAAFSTVNFQQQRDVSTASFVAAGDILIGTTVVGGLGGASVDLKLGDYSKAEIADISVSAPAAGATDSIISITLANGEVFQTGAGLTNDITSGASVTLTNQSNPDETIIFTFGTLASPLTGGDTGDTADSVILLETSDQANAVEDALKTAFGLNAGNGGLNFQVGEAATDSISVAIEGAKTTDIYKDSDGKFTALSIDTSDNAQTASAILDTAINTVVGLRATVGALQSRFDFASSSLNVSLQNTESARASFLDVDVAAESTDFASAQVKLSASISVLAQANQLPQNLLKLLG